MTKSSFLKRVLPLVLLQSLVFLLALAVTILGEVQPVVAAWEPLIYTSVSASSTDLTASKVFTICIATFPGLYK